MLAVTMAKTLLALELVERVTTGLPVACSLCGRVGHRAKDCCASQPSNFMGIPSAYMFRRPAAFLGQSNKQNERPAPVVLAAHGTPAYFSRLRQAKVSIAVRWHDSISPALLTPVEWFILRQF